MIVVDVETSGLNPDKHSLLSIGAVDFSNSKRQFYEECRIWDGAHIDGEALAVNGFTKEQIVDPKKKSEAEIVKDFLDWAQASEEYTVAGENPSLDVAFIVAGARRAHMTAPLHHRTIDLHSICLADMIKRGIRLPIKDKKTDLNSDKIMAYIGIPAEPKPHIGINGAKWEAEALSRLLYNRPFFEDFGQYPIPWLKNGQS
ncbi:MAG: exonuclease domain-containing protein [Candidatus Paceibacterota bacterium]|jgi:hypothetical protein